LVLVLFTTTRIHNQKMMIQDNQHDNTPASIYENYNHVNDADLDTEYYKMNTRNLYDHRYVDLNYLDHLPLITI
jgi:hypothetical protein